jgi:paraquat-inducible protein A
MTTDRKRSLREIHPKRVDILILILLAAACLAIGYYLPVLTVRKLWEKNTFSILSGIISLWTEKYFFLSVIIFIFSVIFPIAKLVSLIVIWFVKLYDAQRKRLLYFMEFLGKWSMLDVFVTAIIVVTVKLGVLASAKAETGILFFGASILLAMLVTTLQNNLVRRS